MQYTLSNIHCEAFDLDDELLNLYFQVHITEPEQTTLKECIFFGELMHYIKKHDPLLHSYWVNTRNGLDLWWSGPAEASTFQAIGEEAIEQIYSFVPVYLSSINFVATTYEDRKKWQATIKNEPKQQEQLVTLANEMTESGLSMKESTQRMRQFCQRLEKSARHIALEVYPEIAEMEPAQLLEFKHLFVREIDAMYKVLSAFRENEV